TLLEIVRRRKLETEDVLPGVPFH
ncbi:MAG: hypothetical protein QOK22_2963, partial [Gaiellaceae bacterium]|nr:hypothetical protein [Gaiellaceae bacterium]